MARRLTVPLAALCAMAIAPPSLAQEQNRFAVGVNFTERLANDELAHGNGGIGIKWRLGHSDSGWGRQIGLGWFATDLDRVVDGRTVSFGELKVRPFVGGYGYTHAIRPTLHLTADLVGGIAFVSFELADEADSAFRGLPAGPVTADVSSVIPVIRPEVSVWYDIHRKFGLSLGAGYTFARPTLTIASAGSRSKERLRADTFALSAGLVYRIF